MRYAILAVALALAILAQVRIPGPGGSRPGPTPWMSATGGGTTRLYSGEMGCKVDVGGTPINVTHLGRYCVAGNSGNHDLKIYASGTGSGETPLATVSVNMAGCTAGTWVYGTVSQTLSASTTYMLSSVESASGDEFLDDNVGAPTVTGVASVNISFYDINASGNAHTSGRCYVPINFKY